jgi:hypothetical protein
MWTGRNGFRRFVDFICFSSSGEFAALRAWQVGELSGGTGRRAEGLEVSAEGFEDAGFDGEEGKLPFPADVDETAGLEFLDVVRESCRGDGESFVGCGAAEGTLGAGNGFEEFEALGISKGLKDGGALEAGEADGFCGRYRIRFWFRGRHVHFGVLDAMVMDYEGCS